MQAARRQREWEKLEKPKPKPKPAAPATKDKSKDETKGRDDKAKGKSKDLRWRSCKPCDRQHSGECWICDECGERGHTKERCKEGKKEAKVAEQHGNEAGEQCSAGDPDILVVRCQLQGVAMEAGADTMAAVNIIRGDALPPGAKVVEGGVELLGVGQVQSDGVVELSVELGGVMVGKQEFVVVQTLPVPAILGKKLLAAVQAKIDVAAGKVQIRAGGKKALLRAVAVPAKHVESERPKAQAYWNWLAVHMSKAGKKLQTCFQETMERADDTMLLEFLVSYCLH